MRVALVGAYEMGRQPFGLAEAAAHLEAAGFDVTCSDLSRQRLEDCDLADAALVAFSLPMHTATRIVAELLPRVRARAPVAKVACWGLYAPLNAAHLRGLGVEHVLGPEAEGSLVALALALKSGGGFRDEAQPALPRTRFRTPSRATLPPLEGYAHLCLPDGSTRVTGYVEATRGCKHTCRHCPIVPVYQGRFRAVPAEVVLADIEQQVAAGAQHITFGDPDFLNGRTHALGIVRALHARFPDVSYDAIIKVEHLLQHRDVLPALVETGCALVTTAAESLDDEVLSLLNKGHTRAGLEEALRLCDEVGLPLSPTWLPFAPWTTLADYVRLLEGIEALSLIESTAPVQLTIRLLLPSGSLLLERDEVARHVLEFDPGALAWPWRHPDPRVDALQRELSALVERDAGKAPRRETFRKILNRSYEAAGLPPSSKATPAGQRCTVPFLNEPWYC